MFGAGDCNENPKFHQSNELLCILSKFVHIEVAIKKKQYEEKKAIRGIKIE